MDLKGSNNFYLLLVEFCYCQYMKHTKIDSYDMEIATIIGGILLLAGLV